MRRATRSLAILLLLSFSRWPALADASPEGLFRYGLWEGSVELRSRDAPVAEDAMAAATESFALRLFPADPEAGAPEGGLVDMPSRGLYGFPMGEILRDSEGISFTLRGKAPFDGLFELRGSPLPGTEEGSLEADGAIRLLSAEGEDERTVLAEGGFTLAYGDAFSRGLDYGIDYAIATGRGALPGSLLLPEDGSDEARPLVLILSGAQADRDGNNYAVPGKSDSLAQLGLSLRSRGVALLRFDKRGTGEAYALAPDEGALRFDDHIEDARAALRLIRSDPRFSSVTVVGFAEGALVGACALAETGDLDDAAGLPSKLPVAGIVALCASGKTEVEMVEEALASAPPELEGEAEAIMSALISGESYPEPSPYFADYFRLGIQPYLSSLFARDIRAALAAACAGSSAPLPLLIVAGENDLQVGADETELLLQAVGGCEYRIIPGMSHALKGVGEDEDANYASFTDPGLPLAEGLVELIAAFAKGEELPGSDPRLLPGPFSQGGEESDEAFSR